MGQNTTERGGSAVPGGETLSLYLGEAGRIPLLDARREAELAETVDRSRRALRRLAGKIAGKAGKRIKRTVGGWPRRGEPWRLEQVDRFVADLRGAGGRAAPAELVARVRGHKARLDDARDRLIVANLRLVVHIAKKYPHPGLSLPDLIQEGNLGLMKAVDRFDHARGNRFTTYAYWWIKQSIERAIGNHGRTVRVPVHVQEKLRRVRRSSDRLRTRHEREPTTEEIARETGIDPTKVREVLRHARSIEPLEDPDRALDSLRREADPQAVCPFERASSVERRRVVEAALEPLSPQERQVIRMRFGLGVDAVATLGSVGDAMDLSRERVRQIERRALAKIASSPHRQRLSAWSPTGGEAGS